MHIKNYQNRTQFDKTIAKIKIVRFPLFLFGYRSFLFLLLSKRSPLLSFISVQN